MTHTTRAVSRMMTGELGAAQAVAYVRAVADSDVDAQESILLDASTFPAMARLTTNLAHITLAAIRSSDLHQLLDDVAALDGGE